MSLAPGAHAGAVGDEGQKVDALLSEWRFPEAEQALAALVRKAPAAAETLYLEGQMSFLSGDYAAAVAKLKAALAQAPDEGSVKMLLSLATNAGKAIEGHKEARSAHFLLRYPPEDEVLVDHALETLEAALAGLQADLGYTPTRPIPVDIYRAPEALASVSTLTEEEVRRTGTIALCKWGRLMATSPRALAFGYPWQDSVSHELVHYVVSSLTHDKAPVWLQEGLAKFLERRWHEPPSAALPPSMQHLLAKAIASNNFISFERMHPSMAKLPTAEQATLAFAEVATAIASLHAKKGAEGLRTAIGLVRDGEDARAAVAQAAGTSWAEFERGWKTFIAAQKYKTFPGLDPVTRKFRKASAIASKRGPSEDEEIGQVDASKKFLRLGNMMLLRNRPKAAALEYEKGAKGAGREGWVFGVKLGRTYLALGQPDRAIKAVADASTLYPELPWPHLIAGRALLDKGNAPEAIASLESSLATNPFDPEVHCSLAEAYGKVPAPTPRQAELRTRAERNCQALRRP